MKKMNMKARRYAMPQQGFTLIELLLVLVILGLIGGLVITNLVGKTEGAKVKAASAQVDRLSMAVENYYLDTGGLPENLDSLVESNGDEGGWNGPYVKESLLKDPWGNTYEYRQPGEHGQFDLWSNGADGSRGGEGNNADITSWQ